MSKDNSSEQWLMFLNGNGVDAQKILQELENFIAGGESRHADKYINLCRKAWHSIEAMKKQAVSAVNATHSFKETP